MTHISLCGLLLFCKCCVSLRIQSTTYSSCMFFSLHGWVLILISHRNTSYIPSSSLAALRWRRKVSLIIGDKSNNKRIRQSFLASLVFMERTRTPQIQRSGCLHLQISTTKFCVFSICSFRYFFNRT